ncbi:uncharacterized protein BT62DRAFT_928601 [Guyanagaster necrorhizus]|uniref:Uncharacterized protein n=1 Tax=Guyanagaster necrorhizus TaxID=856835 RepID=A0A9P8AVT0_9AGAR|nr:uncharacterized protein BT62DRAFT_928601 [Guyanagaster necrorhizus MCA 3950]KAG7449853.1 hypothetical protein BT62DRAFT_928601 [Guyanagaster necrorhizus MCA 3950]
MLVFCVVLFFFPPLFFLFFFQFWDMSLASWFSRPGEISRVVFNGFAKYCDSFLGAEDVW